MKTSEVDRLERVYQAYSEEALVQLRWSDRNAGNRYILRERRRVMVDILRAAGWWPLSQASILEIGCGGGKVLAELLDLGAVPDRLVGIDLLDERIETARARLPDVKLLRSNAEQLPFGSGTFDLVFAFTVFSSILDPTMARNVAAEMQRVLKPGGAVIWYDIRCDNPRNPHVRRISSKELRRLFPDFDLGLRTVTVLPPLARRFGALARGLYPALASIPLLRTHYLGLLVKPS